MSAPSHTLTWTIRGDLYVPSETNPTIGKKAFFKMKDTLVTVFGWTVFSSSNSSSAGASDLWLSFSNLVWGTGARSWIVFNRPNGEQVCFDLYGWSADYTWMGSMTVSPGGLFTGGTASARPTATDEIILVANGENLLTTGDAAPRNWYIAQSSDGHNTRIVHMQNNGTTTAFFFERLQSPISTFVDKSLAGGLGIGSALTYSNWVHTGRLKGRLVGSTAVTASFLCPGTRSGGLGEHVNVRDLDGELVMLRMKAYSNTSGYKGILGTVPDLYMGSSLQKNGDTFPDGLGNPGKWLCLDHMIFPWNNTRLQSGG
jgi:hypothetical protein